MNEQYWFEDSRFNQFWKSYSNAQQFSNNKYFNDYYQNFSIMQQASYFAHYSAINELSKSSLNFEPKSSEDLVEFEISDDLVEFYRESRKFKKEKKEVEKSRLKDLSDGTTTKHVSGEQVNLESFDCSKTAPLERVGQRREEELLALYGKKAKSIHLIETRIQMKYNHNLDLFQPNYWPSFPLKLKFN